MVVVDELTRSHASQKLARIQVPGAVDMSVLVVTVTAPTSSSKVVLVVEQIFEKSNL